MTSTAPAGPSRSVSLEAWERRTTKPLLIAAVTFIAVLTIPVIDPHLSGAARDLIDALDVGIWLAFVVDYLARLWLAPARWRFVKRNIPDLLTVLLPALRPLRLLRLLSVSARVARNSASSALVHTSRAVGVSAVLLAYLGAVGVLDAERHDRH